MDVPPDATHKSLGRIYASAPTQRRHPGFQHRVQLAWANFHQFRAVLTNKHVSIKLRLKLFDALVTPRVLFGLVTNAADTKTIDSTIRLEAQQTRMMRSIVGSFLAANHPCNTYIQWCNQPPATITISGIKTTSPPRSFQLHYTLVGIDSTNFLTSAFVLSHQPVSCNPFNRYSHCYPIHRACATNIL